MPHRRTPSLALAALLGAALTIAACGPGTPPSDPTGGGSGGGGSGGSGTGSGSGSGGSGAGGGSGTDSGGGTSGGGGGESGGGGSSVPSPPAAFASVLGGAGDEWCQGVAAAPGNTVVALTVVGPRGDGGFDQLGLTRLDASGAQPGRLYDLGAPVSFPRDGAVNTGPNGEVYLALNARCGSGGCRGLGTPFDGAGLLQFSPGGDPAWLARLPGDVVSQPVVDPGGNVAVATSEGGANVVRSFAPSGALRWATALPGGAGDVFLAADSGSNVLAARGDEVFKLSTAGAIAWSRSIAVQVAGVAGTASGVVVLAGTGSGGAAVVELQPDGTDGPVRALPGPGSDVRVQVGGGRRIGAITGAGGCGATITALDVDSGQLWTRPLAASGCDASQLRASALTVTTSGMVVVGGALAGSVDLGGAQVTSRATDAIVAGFGP